MKLNRLVCALVALMLFSGLGSVKADTASALSNEVILIVRHAEKQLDGPGLTPDGVKRSNLYVNYFENFLVDGKKRPPDVLYAAADSSKTQRCRLTITPLSQALGIPINASFKNKDVEGLAQALAQNPGGKTVLIAWHHEEIANLLTALGANSSQLVPLSGWPEDRYNWLIELRYDDGGHLIPSQEQVITEHLLRKDSE